MSESFANDQIIKMILGAVEKIKAKHALLSKLDSATGDGDHGTAMLRVAQAIEKTIDEKKDEPLKSLVEKLGWSVMGVDGGSTGPLMGSFFTGISESMTDAATFDGGQLAAMFTEGLKKVQTITKAKVGDKTMIDALVPAVEKFQNAIEQNESVPVALEQAAAAAAEGARATKDMQAKFGRAKNLGDRTLGHADPGATSTSMIFQGFYEGFDM
jgi:dihydroxyacetone kinase-like protein